MLKRAVLTRSLVSALCLVFVCSALAFSPGVVRAKAMSDTEFAALCSEGTAGQIQQALKDGANPNAVDEQGFPALGNAIANKNPGTAEALLAAGAEVNVVAIGGVTPLMMAADRDVGLVRALLAAGAEVNVTASPVSRVISPLMLAAGSGKADIVAALLEAGAGPSLVDEGENEEETPHDALWHARHPDEGVSREDAAACARLLEEALRKRGDGKADAKGR